MIIPKKKAIEIPDGLISLRFKPCTTGKAGTGEVIESIGNVHSIQIKNCEWTGRSKEWCGLKIGSFNEIYVEYDMANARSLSNRKIKKYPKKGEQLDIAICGRIPVQKLYFDFLILKKIKGVPFCAPFSLPNTNACEQGYSN